MMEHKVIAFVGMPGCGKGTCTDYLENKGWPKVYFGGMVYDEVALRGLDIVRDERFVREDMRKKDGVEVLAKRAAAKADKSFASGHPVVVLDGLYSWSEYTYLRKKYVDDLTVIAIFTPRAERYRRTAARRDGKRVYTEADIERRDIEEIEGLEKGGPIAIADYTLLNDGGVDDLLAKLESTLEQIGLKP
jgi:dephospho-CoA kinase